MSDKNNVPVLYTDSTMVIIELACDVDFDELAREDVDANGQCIRDGMYRIDVVGKDGDEAVEVALDWFLNNSNVFDIDCFTCTGRLAKSPEKGLGLGHFRDYCGRIEPTAPALGHP